MNEHVREHLRELRSGAGARREAFQSRLREQLRPLLNEQAEWKFELTTEFGRQDLQLCAAFLAGNAEERAFANLWLRRIPFATVDRCVPGPTTANPGAAAAGQRHFGIFDTSIACEYLLLFAEQLEPETEQLLLRYLAEGLEDYPGMPAPDFQFHGYNTNMPAMAVKTLICGGELLHDERSLEVGRWKLRRLAGQLSRAGVISEYNSPNYTPDTVGQLSTLARYARDPECQELAAKCARRVWLDLAAHYHPGLRTPAGPFSRAYAHDYNGYLSSECGLLWFLFGPEATAFSALEAITPRPGLELMHGNDWLEHAARLCWYSLLDDFLLEEETAALFLSKSYPFEVRASAEHGDAGDGFSPIKRTALVTRLEADFALGSVSFPFLNGVQTASCHLAGKPLAASGVAPVLYPVYSVNQERPGNREYNDFQRRTYGEAEFHNRATLVTVQEEKSVLVSAIPHRTLTGTPVTELELLLVAPDAFGQFGGFFDAGGKPLEPGKRYPADAWYGAVLGGAFAAIHPLAGNPGALPAPEVELYRNGQYQLLAIRNYRGAERRFTREELCACFNGFTLEAAAAADYHGSLSAFLEALQAAQWEDQFYFRTRRLRYQRPALPDRPELQLALDYSSWADGSALRTVNGRYAPEPVWQLTGETAIPPLLGQDGCPVPPGVPYRSLQVAFCPDEPWAIFHH